MASNRFPVILTLQERFRLREEFLLFFTMALITEGSLALYVYLDAVIVLWFLALHFLVVFILIGWTISLHNRGLDYGISALLVLCTMTIGVIGVLGMLVAVVYLITHRETKGYERELFNEQKDKQTRSPHNLYKKIISGREGFATKATVSSFMDTIMYGSHKQKHALIALLARRFKPQFAPVLRCALVDSTSDIRVQAATAVANIEQKYSAKWTVLKNRVESDADNYEAHFTLAKHLDDYAFVGLLDEERKAVIQQRAMESYQQCQKLTSENRDLSLAIGRLLVRQGEISAAIKVFESLSPDTLTVSDMSWYGQCLFVRKRYDDLRQLLAKWRSTASQDSHDLPEKLQGVFKLWQLG